MYRLWEEEGEGQEVLLLARRGRQEVLLLESLSTESGVLEIVTGNASAFGSL